MRTIQGQSGTLRVPVLFHYPTQGHEIAQTVKGIGIMTVTPQFKSAAWDSGCFSFLLPMEASVLCLVPLIFSDTHNYLTKTKLT